MHTACIFQPARWPEIVTAHSTDFLVFKVDVPHSILQYTSSDHSSYLVYFLSEFPEYENSTAGPAHLPVERWKNAKPEQLHREHLLTLKEEMLKVFPHALILGAGGCRICKKCAYPESCRFPEKAISSMEAYGLFVTQVCRDNNIKYYYGPKTITYTGCVLF